MPSAVNPGQRVTERAKKSLYSHGDPGHGERLKVSEVAVAERMLVSENATALGHLGGHRRLSEARPQRVQGYGHTEPAVDDGAPA